MNSDTFDGDHRRLHVMIIDDEAIVCKRLRSAFIKLGYTVEAFNDSASALERLQQSSFDIVITDLKMEGVDGLQILSSARAAHPATRVVIITGFATLETAKESFHQGAFDFVAKPFKLSDIIECVRKIETELRAISPDGPSAVQVP